LQSIELEETEHWTYHCFWKLRMGKHVLHRKHSVRLYFCLE